MLFRNEAFFKSNVVIKAGEAFVNFGERHCPLLGARSVEYTYNFPVLKARSWKLYMVL